LVNFNDLDQAQKEILKIIEIYQISMMKNLQFLPCGDTAFSVQLGFDINRETCLKVLSLKATIEKSSVAGLIETVPSYRSLLVHYDPLQTRQQTLIKQIVEIIETPNEIKLLPKRWQVPVCYDPEFAWDILEVGETVDKTTDELIKLFSSTEFFVYMVGFFLGHLHLGDLPDFMKTLSRRPNPRVRLNSGAMATAQGLAVVHAIASPGGWSVMGRTPIPLFDIRNKPPALFTAGDQITFFPIDKNEFHDIEDRVAVNEYLPEYEEVTI
jgi:inhibitor of KinA